MKFLKITLFSLFVVGLAACGDDDSISVCAPSDWVGTYTGTIDCDGTTEDVTVTITASGANDIIIKYQTATMETEYDPLTPNGCDLNVSSSASGLTISVDADLNGNEITLNEVISDGTNNFTCDLTATR